MSSSNVNAMVKEAIRVLKAGNKAEARQLLERATELDSYNEQAWLWLSGVVETDEDQRTCLNNVLFINPNNTHAKQGVAMLDAKISAKTPDRSVVMPDESPFAGFDDLPKGDNLLDELESMRLESTSTPTGSVSPFTATDFEEMGDDFSDFDDSFSDPFAENQGGPFSAVPFSVENSEQTPLAVPKKQTELESAADSMFSDVDLSRPAKKRRTAEVEVASPVSEPEVTGVAALFRAIPKEIRVTRVPGSDMPTPFLYRIIVLVLVLVDIGAAYLTFSKLFAPLGTGQG